MIETRTAIVLAAGFSRRFGANKLLADWNGKPLVSWAIASACAAPVDKVYAVVGHDHEDVSAVISRYAERPVTRVFAPDFVEGMAASLKAGLDVLPEAAASTLIFLGDMPAIPVDISAALLSVLTPDHPAAAPVYQGKRGHPAAFHRDIFPILRMAAGDKGAGFIFDELGERWTRVACLDKGVLFDVDVPSALQRETDTPDAYSNFI